MLTAAYGLFCEQGYRATTMAAVAERAGVAVQTLYLPFHTKDEMPQHVHDWTVLTDNPTPPPLRTWHSAAVAEPDPARVVVLILAGTAGTAGILAHVATLIQVFHPVAAEPAGAVCSHSDDLRVQGMRDLITGLQTKGTLRQGLTANRAVDLLVVLLGPECCWSFVIDQDWS